MLSLLPIEADMPAGEPPPLYKPEMIEPKKRLSFLQHCYKEPWVPVGEFSRPCPPASPRVTVPI